MDRKNLVQVATVEVTFVRKDISNAHLAVVILGPRPS